MSIFEFFNKPKPTVESEPPASAALWKATAVDESLEIMRRLPEVDEILKQAGMTRAALKKLTSDDEIYQAMRTRRIAAICTPWTFEGGSTRIHKLLWEELEPLMEDIVGGAVDAVFYGYSVMEVVYKVREIDNKVGLESVFKKPLDWFEPQPNGSLRYFPKSGPNTSQGIDCDLNFKFLLTRSDASYDCPRGEALLSRLYWPWFFRYNGWRFWGQFLERFGQPLLVGKSQSPAKMIQELVKAHQDATIAIGQQDEVLALSPDSDGTAFDKLEDAILRRIQKVILGQTLTSDAGGKGGGGGSYALGQVHNKVREDLKRSDIRVVRATVQKLVKALCVLNGLSLEQVPDVVFQEAQELNRERAERDTRLAGIGVRFTKDYFIARYDLLDNEFDIPDPEEAELDPNITRAQGRNLRENKEGKANEVVKKSEGGDPNASGGRSVSSRDGNKAYGGG